MVPPDDDAAPPDDDLSDDPDEQLRYENELLKLKLQAELGAVFGTSDDIPPEVEQQFLQQVLLFEKMKSETDPVRLGDYLEAGAWPAAEVLSASELDEQWEALQTLLREKRLQVDFLAEYPLAVKYNFITQELVEEQLYPPVLEGQLVGFIYEEYHPNHAHDIEQLAERLLRDFFNNDIHADTDYFSEPLVVPASPLSRAGLSDRVARFHDVFNGIRNWEFEHGETTYEIHEAVDGESVKAGPEGAACVEGIVRYTVLRDDGGEQEITGPFKAFFSLEEGWWTVFFFVLEGFSWK